MIEELFSKSQEVRIIDILFLGPFMIWYGIKSKEMPMWARTTMVISGILTIWYNWRNYSLNLP